MPGLVGMADTGCKTKRCIPPVFVHIVSLASDGTHARYILGRSGYETVWHADPLVMDDVESGDGELGVTSLCIISSTPANHVVAGGRDSADYNSVGRVQTVDGTYAVLWDDEESARDSGSFLIPDPEFPETLTQTINWDTSYGPLFALTQESEAAAAGVFTLLYHTFNANTGIDCYYTQRLVRSVFDGGAEIWALCVYFHGFCTGAPPPPPIVGDYRGAARIGEEMYVCTNASIYAWSVFDQHGVPQPVGQLDIEGETNGAKIVKVLQFGEDDPVSVWLNMSGFLSLALWMIYDEQRELFWVLGHDVELEGVLAIYKIDLTGGETRVATLDETDVEVAAVTVLSDGIWFAATAADDPEEDPDGERLRIYRYGYDANPPELILTKSDAGSWPVFVGGVAPNHYLGGLGEEFFLGSTETCNRFCECAPGLTLERVWEEPPGEEDPICSEAPAHGACCGNFADGPTRAALNLISCAYRFDCEITLCPGRTLRELVVQGSRGAVFLDDVPIVDITDWESLPLTGQIRFEFGNATGPITGTLRVTAIDSEGCCTTVTVDLECCRCEPAGGGVSESTDVYEPAFLDDGWFLDNFPDVSAAYRGANCEGGRADVMHWYQLEFLEGEPSDCGDLDDGGLEDWRICYSIDWDGCEARGGGELPSLAVAGDVIRYRAPLATGGDSTPRCIRVWANDILGGSECRTLIAVITHIGTSYVFEPGADTSGLTECQLSLAKFWTCTEDGGQFFEE
jgi:hypothetical protein